MVNGNETCTRDQPNSCSIGGMYRPIVSTAITLGPSASPIADPSVVSIPEAVASDGGVVESMCSPRSAVLVIRARASRQREDEQLIAAARMQIRRQTCQAEREARPAGAHRDVSSPVDCECYGV